jgi:hypothetical protein
MRGNRGNQGGGVERVGRSVIERLRVQMSGVVMEVGSN